MADGIGFENASQAVRFQHGGQALNVGTSLGRGGFGVGV
jgi:hypothetical protein